MATFKESGRRVERARMLLDSADVLTMTDTEVAATVAALTNGSTMLKFGRKGKPQKRVVRLTPDGDAITWTSKRKRPSESTIPLSSIVRVQRGQHTSGFARFLKDYRGQQHLSFSIICDGTCCGGRQSVDLLATTVEDFQMWTKGLQLLLFRSRVQSGDGDRKVLRRSFQHALSKASSAKVAQPPALGYTMVKALLRNLNIFVQKRNLKPLFDRMASPAGDVTFEDTVRIVELIRDRPDVRRLYNVLLAYQHGQPGAEHSDGLTPPTVLYFLHVYQHETEATMADAKRLIRHAQVMEAADVEETPRLGLPGFTAHLTHMDNSVFAPERAAEYQDMTRPLNHYWINSSHNTYLEGDQLSSVSSVNMYINVLTRGCRCVELDCWDGPDGEPIIYHGHTLTSRILFSDVVKAIAEYGFKTSAYPIILSLEVHCSIPQQDRMAAIVVEELGDALQLPPAERVPGQPLPSPRDLLGRVLLKGKTVDSPMFGVEPIVTTQHGRVVIEGWFFSQDAAAGGVEAPPTRGPSNSIGSAGSYSEVKEEPFSGAGGGVGADVTPVKARHPKPKPKPTPKSTPKKKHKYRPCSQALSDVTYLQGVKFPGFAVAEKYGEAWITSSIKEPKASKLAAKTPADFLKHTRKQLLRVYPGPLRVDSSNFKPFPLWCAGCQMVALNLQTVDTSTQLNNARFRENGRCGYVLMPPLTPTVRKGSKKSWGAVTPRATDRASPPPSHLRSPAEPKPGKPPMAPPRMDGKPDSAVPGVGGVQIKVFTPRETLPLETPVPGIVPGGLGSSSLRPAEGDAGLSVDTSSGGEALPLPPAPPSAAVKEEEAAQVYEPGLGPGPEVAAPLRVPPPGAEAGAGAVASPIPPPTPTGVHIQYPSPLLNLRPGCTLVLELMGGQYLPKPSDEGDVVSPFCSLTIYGDPRDTQKLKSTTVTNNGLNPVWEQRFEFVLAQPLVAIVHVTVHHRVEIGRNQRLGYWAAPLTALRAGYRIIPLRTLAGKRIPFCSLLCRVSIE